MKKILTLSLASAMVLSMSTGAFADISFGSNSSSTADWPNEFGFAGNLLVFDGDAILSTEIGESNSITIHPGNTIYMPLYHNVIGDGIVTIGESAPTTGVIPYKGKIDKNWKVNFVEKSKRFIDTAEFYRAKTDDKNLVDGAVYIKVEVVEELDSVKKETINYGVYVSEKGGKNKTKQVYVKGDFSNPTAPNFVDFEWSNQVSGPMVWEVEKNDDGTAIFDFEDEATYSVKMFGSEKVLLNLSRTYDKKIVSKYDVDMEFYNFKGDHDSFSAVGVLSVPGDKNSYAYEIVKGGLKPVDYSYNSEDETIEIKTRVLGSYVVSEKELEIEVDEEEVETEKPSTDGSGNNSTGNGSTGSTNKPNPSTGANSMVDAAVALAAVSMVGGVALLKKRK